MHNSVFMAGQKMLLTHLRARLVKFFLFYIVFTSKIKPNVRKLGLWGPDWLKAFAGHIWPAGLMLYMLALDAFNKFKKHGVDPLPSRGPLCWRACMIFSFLFSNTFFSLNWLKNFGSLFSHLQKIASKEVDDFKMDLPNWINRETIQLVLIFAITVGFHYYFISSRIEGMGSSSGPDLGLKTQSEWKKCDWKKWQKKNSS